MISRATMVAMLAGLSLPLSAPAARADTEDQILEWADAYHKLTGKWPTPDCRPRVG